MDNSKEFENMYLKLISSSILKIRKYLISMRVMTERLDRYCVKISQFVLLFANKNVQTKLLRRLTDSLNGIVNLTYSRKYCLRAQRHGMAEKIFAKSRRIQVAGHIKTFLFLPLSKWAVVQGTNV